MNRRKFLSFLVLVVVFCVGLAICACFRTVDQSAQRQRDSIAKLLETYIDSYKSGDWGQVRFAADVTFEGPLTNGKLLGKPAVQKFLSNAIRQKRWLGNYPTRPSNIHSKP